MEEEFRSSRGRPARAKFRGIAESTHSCERWLGKHVKLIRPDLARKHAAMRKDLHYFLRASFYRWAEVFPVVCADESDAPEVLAVGDLHVENFGTWRDAEGRLVWGVNDFDEAWRLPYTNDLVRMATSARIAARMKQFRLSEKAAVAAILEGYRAGLREGKKPFVLGEGHATLREIAEERLQNTARFWRKIGGPSPVRGGLSRGLERALSRSLPEGAEHIRFARRIAGLGSIGRPRVVGIAEWMGGLIVREAKALCPSAVAWSSGEEVQPQHLYREILRRAVHSPDPFMRVKQRWTIRRLSPDCVKLELGDLPKKCDERHLLVAMGWETANVHSGTASTRRIIQDLRSRRGSWLERASKEMAEAIKQDWSRWRQGASRASE